VTSQPSSLDVVKRTLPRTALPAHLIDKGLIAAALTAAVTAQINARIVERRIGACDRPWVSAPMVSPWREIALPTFVAAQRPALQSSRRRWSKSVTTFALPVS